MSKKRVCPTCGKKIPIGQRDCQNCGAKFVVSR